MAAAASNQVYKPHEWLNDAFVHSLSFLDKRCGPFDETADLVTLLATAVVCKQWKNSADFIIAREKAATLFREHKVSIKEIVFKNFPSDLIQRFLQADYSIEQFPVLHFEKRNAKTLLSRCGPSIDFIKLEEMRFPVMKFRDQENRLGVALHVHAHRDFITFMNPSFREGGHDAILVFVQQDPRQSNSINNWFFTWGNSEQMDGRIEEAVGSVAKSDRLMQQLYIQRHHLKVGSHKALYCGECPFQGRLINFKTLSALLDGTDPDFSLGGAHPRREEDDGKEPG